MDKEIRTFTPFERLLFMLQCHTVREARTTSVDREEEDVKGLFAEKGLFVKKAALALALAGLLASGTAWAAPAEPAKADPEKVLAKAECRSELDRRKTVMVKIDFCRTT